MKKTNKLLITEKLTNLLSGKRLDLYRHVHKSEEGEFPSYYTTDEGVSLLMDLDKVVANFVNTEITKEVKSITLVVDVDGRQEKVQWFFDRLQTDAWSEVESLLTSLSKKNED